MCLYTQDTKPLRADRDITCYKIVNLHYDDAPNPEPFRSKFFNFRYGLGKTYKLNGRLGACISKRVTENGVLIFEVNKGFHSYKDYKHAIEEYRLSELVFSQFFSDKEYVHIMLECVIPKGSLYYKGEDNDLCSNALRVNRWGYCVREPEWSSEQPDVKPESDKAIL